MDEQGLQAFLKRCDAMHRAFFVELAHEWMAAGQPAEVLQGAWALSVRTLALGGDDARLVLFALHHRSPAWPERIEIDLNRWRSAVGEQETDRLLRAVDALNVFPLYRRHAQQETLVLPAPAHQDDISLRALKTCIVAYALRARDLFPC
ncbi:MAG: hypothetical protein D6703_00590 [Zetaproteobacteria bacterium]|nr:MAG: hypothetical protein D6703_00590 [Zetaproteobacteria bacterium]